MFFCKKHETVLEGVKPLDIFHKTSEHFCSLVGGNKTGYFRTMSWDNSQLFVATEPDIINEELGHFQLCW